MPKRFIEYSRTEPARTILATVAFLTFLSQGVALFLDWPSGIINFAVVAAVSIWGMAASYKNNIKQMSLSSFWLFMMWLFSGLSRLLIFTPDWTMMLWAPMLIVAAALSVVYLYLSFQRRAIKAGLVKEVEDE